MAHLSPSPVRLQRRLALATAIVLLVVAACGSSSGATVAPSVGPSLVAPTPAGSRPSSPAVLTFVSPTPNEVISGTSLHVQLTLQGATIVPATTTNISPTTGHVHLYVDNTLVSMNYQLTQDLPVHAGTYVIYAEFVAADHAPFDPRVKTPEIIFSVK
jgi:hypothetical protein